MDNEDPANNTSREENLKLYLEQAVSESGQVDERILDFKRG